MTKEQVRHKNKQVYSTYITHIKTKQIKCKFWLSEDNEASDRVRKPYTRFLNIARFVLFHYYSLLATSARKLAWQSRVEQ